MVSIHAPAKGATQIHADCLADLNVSIHAPAKGATAAPPVYRSRLRVSIHAPAKGATYGYRFVAQVLSVSIHAPAKGATVRIPVRRTGTFGFNPRSREGSDDLFPPKSIANSIVSIHAPAKGATAISAKNSFYFSAKINKLSFYILNFPLFPSPLFSTFHFICAHFRVRIPRHFYVCFLFALLYYHKINVSSTAIPRSTPICSTFV